MIPEWGFRRVFLPRNGFRRILVPDEGVQEGPGPGEGNSGGVTGPKMGAKEEFLYPGMEV